MFVNRFDATWALSASPMRYQNCWSRNEMGMTHVEAPHFPQTAERATWNPRQRPAYSSKDEIAANFNHQ